MTGWNMPPGCNVSDIPGNTPEDQKAEAMADAVASALEALTTLAHKMMELIKGDHSIVDRAEDTVSLEMMKLIDKAYSTGYADGIQDEQWATVNTEILKGGDNE